MSDWKSNKDSPEDLTNENSNIQKYKEETLRLKAMIKDLQSKMSAQGVKKDIEIAKLSETVTVLKSENYLLKENLKKLEIEKAEFTKKISIFQTALKNQIRSKPPFKDEIIQEIDQIEDPLALVVINKLLFLRPNQVVSNEEPKNLKNQFENLRNSIELENNQTILKLITQNNESDVQIKILKTQNEFLLSQLDYAEKKLVSVGIKPDFNQYHLDNLNLKTEICRIFQLCNGDDILESLRLIERGYQYVPVMQATLEQIYMIITNNKFLPAVCNSKNQMIEILENWAGNLVDYQNLVKTLFEIMGVSDPNLKNRTYLVESIRKLAFNSTIDKNESEASIFNERPWSKNGPSNEIFEEIKNLKKENNAIEFFREDAKMKLNLPSNYSNEALYAKILKILDDGEIIKKCAINFDTTTCN